MSHTAPLHTNLAHIEKKSAAHSVSCIFGLPLPVARLCTLLFPNVGGYLELNPQDLFLDLETDPARFFRMSGETPMSLLQIVTDIDHLITNQGHGRHHRHSSGNRVLIAMIWLRQYPTYDVSASLCNILPAAISRESYVLIPLLWYYFHARITWPTVEEWAALRGHWPMFPNAVGAIDGILNEILQPQSEAEHEFYSGYSRFHCMSTQIVIDSERNLRFVQSGFLGRNDASQYELMPGIGPGLQLPFPKEVCPLGDNGYANRYPIMTKFRADQIQQVMDNADQAVVHTQFMLNMWFHILNHIGLSRRPIDIPSG